MISKPIVAPVKGDPLRASWGAAVAERANECADAIDVLRGPRDLSSQREPKAAHQPSLYPLKVRFVPSEEDGASPVDGDLIVYMPSAAHAAGLALGKRPRHGRGRCPDAPLHVGSIRK